MTRRPAPRTLPRAARRGPVAAASGRVARPRAVAADSPAG
ncbi:hypothetical protein QE401_003156 [Pseudoroseomonas cervicalis]|nr:hypothetical protein [Pseudoroseomonas cervicalis]